MIKTDYGNVVADVENTGATPIRFLCCSPPPYTHAAKQLIGGARRHDIVHEAPDPFLHNPESTLEVLQCLGLY